MLAILFYKIGIYLNIIYSRNVLTSQELVFAVSRLTAESERGRFRSFAYLVRAWLSWHERYMLCSLYSSTLKINSKQIMESLSFRYGEYQVSRVESAKAKHYLQRAAVPGLEVRNNNGHFQD